MLVVGLPKERTQLEIISEVDITALASPEILIGRGLKMEKSCVVRLMTFSGDSIAMTSLK